MRQASSSRFENDAGAAAGGSQSSEGS